jgi:hypothetical protein
MKKPFFTLFNIKKKNKKKKRTSVILQIDRKLAPSHPIHTERRIFKPIGFATMSQKMITGHWLVDAKFQIVVEERGIENMQ